MASIGLKINQPYGGGVDTGVADVFAKAMFGDPEAAAKIALAKAQIATQGAAAANYGATTAFTNSKTQQNEAELAARKAGVQPLGALLAASVPEPVGVEAPRPLPNFQGPMPTIVRPEDQKRHDAAVAAAPALAEASLVGGGGNAKQIMDAALSGAGGFGLINPNNPANVRANSTLYTGTAPSNTSTLMPGDTAGAANEIAIDAAKPSADKIIKDKAGNSYSIETDPATGEKKAVPVPGMPVVEPGASGPFEGESAEMAYNRIIAGYNDKKSGGQPTTPEEDRAYALAYNARFGDKVEIRQDSEGRNVPIVISSPPPNGIAVPGQSSTVSGAPAPAAAPVAPGAGAVAPAAQVAAAAAPQFPLPASPASVSPLLGPGRPVAVSSAAPIAPAPAAGPTGPVAPLPAPVPVGGGAPVAPPPQPGQPRVTTLPPVGEPKRVPATEFQGRNSAFLRDAYKAEKDLKNITAKDVPSTFQQWLGDPTQPGLMGRFMNAAADNRTKQFNANMIGFVNGILRRDSGAAIRPEEFPLIAARFIPQPGDDDETIRLKAENRIVALDGLKDGALSTVPLGEDGKPTVQGTLDAIDALVAARSPSKAPAAGGGGGDSSASLPQGVTKEEWDAMSPEDRKLFQ